MRHQFRRELYEAQGGLCHLCGKPMAKSPARKKKNSGSYSNGFTEDHIVPGRRRKANILLAHWACNNARNNTPATEAQLAHLEEVMAKLPKWRRDA